MPTYELAGKDVHRLVGQILKKYRGELQDADISIDVLMVHAKRDGNGDPVGPALKLHGHPCIAKIKIMSLKDRAAGRGDAEMQIDGDRWHELADEEQAAVIDHELTHLELQVGDNGLKRDDLDRPKLRIRHHDHQFGWFDDVVRRHGRNSIEWQQHDQFMEFTYAQLWLPGIEEAASH